MANPLESHWTAVKRILRYLKAATPGIPIPIKALCDAD